MPANNSITINLSRLDFFSFNFSEVDLSQIGLYEIDLTNAGFSDIDLTKVDLTNIDLTHVDLTNVDFSKVDPHLTCLVIFFPYLKQRMEQEKQPFFLENGFYPCPSCIDPKKINKHRRNFHFEGAILVRQQEKKENSTKPKDGYRIEVLGKAEDKGGGFGVIHLVEKTIRLKSDFTLDKTKLDATSSKKRIVKKQKVWSRDGKDQWRVKINGEEIYKNMTSRELIERESRLLKYYSKLSAKTLITEERIDGGDFVFQIMRQAYDKNLSNLLGSENGEDKQPNFKTRLSLFLALVQEVKDLHDKSKIIHCDLKPENVCAHHDTDSSPFNITLIDFGASKLIEDQATKKFDCQGTDPYFAPEQDSYGAEDLTVKVDVYALGQMMKIDFFTTDLQEKLFYKCPPIEEVLLVKYNENLSECERKQNKALQDLANEMTCKKPEDRLNLDQVIKRLKAIQQELAKEENQAEASVTALEIAPEAKKMDCFPESNVVDSGLELSQPSSTSDSDLSGLNNLSSVDESVGAATSVNLLQLDLNSSVISTFFKHLHEKISENKNKSFYCPPSHYSYSGTDTQGKHGTYEIDLKNPIIVRPQEQKEHSTKLKDGYRIEVLGAAEDKDGGFSITYPISRTICLNSDFTIDKNKPFSNKKRIVKQQKLTKKCSYDKWGIDPKKNKEKVFSTEVEKENKLLNFYSKLGAKTLVECEYTENNNQFVFQIMKEAPGERLDYFLDLELKKPSLPSFQERLKIFSALAREVRDLNHDKKIVHCDLKPENIFVNYSEKNPTVEITLIDFGSGFSTQYRELGVNQTMTPFYFAPEQRENCYSTKADIHALGQMIKKDFFPTDMQDRFKQLDVDQRARYLLYKEKVDVNEDKLLSSERKQKAALQNLAEHMTCSDPKDRWNIDQVIEKLDDIQYEMSSQNDDLFTTENEGEVENRTVIQQGDASLFQETVSYESDSGDSGVSFKNPSLTSSERSFRLSDIDEALTTNRSAVLASASLLSPQEKNEVLTEEDLFATENEEAQALTVTQQGNASLFQETDSYKSDSGDSGIGFKNPSLTSSEHSFVISNIDENLAEEVALDKSGSRTNDSTVLTSASPSRSPVEETMKWTKQAILLARLEKKMNKNLGFGPMQGDLAKLVAKIKEHRYFKEKLKEEETLNQPAKEDFCLTANLARALFALLQQVPDSHQEVDKFDLNLRQAVIDYIAQTYTPDNIKKKDRAVSKRRAEDIGRLLTQLHGAQGERPKTELELEVKVKDWAKKVTNSMGFFGKSALRSRVLAAMDLASNTAPVKPPSVFNCFRAFIR